MKVICGLLACVSGLMMPATAQHRAAVPPVQGRRMRHLPEPESGVLTGRFVARVMGPRISAFSPNVETYIFEADFRGYTQLVKLTHEFLHQEPRFPAGVLDYNRVRSFAAVRDDSCDEPWQNLTTRTVFNADGELVGQRPAIVYAEAAPESGTTGDEVLPCYVVGRITPRLAMRLERGGSLQP